MGLTINYTITTPTSKQAVEGLEKLRQACLDLPFEEVGKVERKDITQADLDYWNELQWGSMFPNNSRENLQKRNELIEARGFTIWELIKADNEPTEIVSLVLYPGEGCEECAITFRKVDGHYEAQEFCKTQYAAHFVRCHTLVVAMLDIAKSIGFEVDVRDEGQFYETRDLCVLAQNLGEYNSLVESIGGQLRAAGWENDQIVCALDKSKNIMVVRNSQ